MLEDRLNKAWDARRGSTAIDGVMRFSSEGLVLGAGTVLAKSDASGGAIAVDPSEPRLQALLTAAHLRRPTAGALAHLCKAAERWSQGHDALATMHLALSQVGTLEQPEADAQRLFLADGLLNAGFEANAIIDAIAAGGTALERLQKYDPNQPRVPSGSGRTSGEWTSTGGSSAGASTGSGSASAAQLGGDASEASASAANSLVDQPEVNPATITHVAQPGSVYACEEAEEDCAKAADYAARNDGGNYVPRFLDRGNCIDAGLACQTMSWVVEDIPFVAGTGQGGAVRFPHGGVVVVEKGKLDRYYPPLFGKPPPIRRSIEAATAPDRNEGLDFGTYSCPPLSVAPSETVLFKPVGFSPCRTVIAMLASKMNAKVTEQTHSLSARWGKIIRARITFSSERSPVTALVICWSAPGSGIGIFMQLESCCGS